MDAVTLFLVCFNLVRCSAAADTITANQSIRDGGETIISARESFELGFFHPGASQNRYLGIWYKAIATGVVWVANRENPVHDNSSVLTITGDGRLQLQNGTGAVIWSSNSSRSVQNPVAQLLDTGNLVVRDANDGNPENYLWQSFDYPTDTLLPGMKFGIDLETGFDRYLSSWTSNDDPAPGDFTYRCDVRGYPQYFLLNGSTPRFRIGSWNGIGFSGLPVVRQNSVIRFNFVLNQREVYYSYDLLNASLASRLVLSQTGVAQRWTWLDRNRGWQVYLTTPMDNCDTYGLCGAYGSCNIGNSPFCGCLDKFQPRNPRDWYTADWSGGCVRRTALDCQNGDGFVKYPGVKLPDTRRSWYNVSLSLPECESECLRSCSCMAYANLNIRYGNGCLLWFDELIDIREFPESGQDLYIRMASSELEDSTAHGSNRKKGQAVKISLAILGGGVLLGLSLSLYFWKKKKNGQKQTEEGTVLHSSDQNGSNECQEDLELPLFDFSTIERVTNNFSINNKLGEGGYGPVYKGVFEDGREIAVKRLSRNSKQGLDEFKNEVLCIAKLQHRNLVKLLGCCIQRDEQILVYEYMPNKSLDAFIFDQTGSKVLDWPKRYRIINGIARGLLYLHQDSRLRIIHRDLKASNILLDKDMDPKISDFGMARSFGGNETEANTNRVVGTYGYMSPEYAVDGFFSIKSDVFSFGVLVLEIVSGRRNRGFHHPDHQHNLLGHAWRLYGEGRSVELIDISMKDSFYFTEVLRSIHVGLLCVQQCPEDRPSMATVVLMLGSEAQLPQPKQPGFYTERDLFKDVFSSSNKAPSGPSGPISACEMTITLLDAR